MRIVPLANATSRKETNWVFASAMTIANVHRTTAVMILPCNVESLTSSAHPAEPSVVRTFPVSTVIVTLAGTANQ
jgi:hypothetical protein